MYAQVASGRIAGVGCRPTSRNLSAYPRDITTQRLMWLLPGCEAGGPSASGRAPVLVEAALDLVAEVVRPHGVQAAQAARRLRVAHHADHDHRRHLDDRHRLPRPGSPLSQARTQPSQALARTGTSAGSGQGFSGHVASPLTQPQAAWSCSCAPRPQPLARLGPQAAR